MNNNAKTLIATAVLGMAVSNNTFAASGDYEADYTRGSYSNDWYLLPSLNITDSDSRFGTNKNATGVGLRFGRAYSPNWDLQFGPTYSRSRSGATRYQQNVFGLDGLFLFSRERFRPFVLIGAGLEYDKVNRGAFHADRISPYVTAGVGFQYSFNNRWGMQADVRRERGYLRGNSFGFERANTDVLTIGMTYAFDRPARTTIVRSTPVPAYPAAPAVVPAPTVVVPPPAPVVAPPPPPRFERFTLSATELFGFDSAVLRMPQRKLDEIADALNRNNQVNNITISGYTDRLGSDKYNLKLSQRRADAVKAYLSNKGVATSRMSAIGKGESNPVVNCTNKKRADLIKCLEPNRRVEVEQIVIERRVQ